MSAQPDEPVFERLGGPPVGVRELVGGLHPEEEAPAGRPRVLVNMVATVDGRIAVDGRSGPIGGPADRALFLWLRTVPDAVMAGTGTLRSERYGRIVRSEDRRAARAAAGRDPDPLAVVPSRSFSVPWDIPLFDAPEQRVAVVTSTASAGLVPPSVRAVVDVIALEDPRPRAALEALRSRYGVRSVLCEGGARLNRGLLEDGVVDELFLSFGPLVTGDAGEPTLVADGPRLAHPCDLELRWLLRHGDEAFLRYAVRRD